MDKKVYEFISTKTNQPIVEWRTCKASGEVFPIYQREKELLEKISPTINGEKFMLDMPNYCYRVRMLQRLIFRNEKKFYYAKCKNTGKKEISVVHDSMGDVLTPKDWYEEDFYKYGIEYSGDFHQDLKKLLHAVPYLSRFFITSENCDYCNQALQEKNCYLCIGGYESEDCMYSSYETFSKNILDCHGTIKNEIGYASIHIVESFKSFFSMYLLSCFNVWFGYDLKNCKNVLFGYGLDSAEYVFKNKRLSKEEWETTFVTYQKKIGTISGLQEVQKEYHEFLEQFPRKAVHNTNAENCAGTQINNSKDTLFAFTTEGDQNGMYFGVGGWTENVMDFESSSMSQWTYNAIGCLKMHNCFCMGNNFEEIKDSCYNYYTRGGASLLGCFGLYNQDYCILNKKYTKENRELLSTKIVLELQSKGKRGEFFDTDLSPFPYNDSAANKIFPIKNIKIGEDIREINPNGIGTVDILDPHAFISDATLDLGGEEKLKIKRRNGELEINIPEGISGIQAKDLPEDINDVKDDILDRAIICTESGRPFRIIKPELEFYRHHHLPLPTLHPDVRDLQRYQQMPNRWLDIYTCAKCDKETLGEYAPNDTRKVYCEDCYNKEIYG